MNKLWPLTVGSSDASHEMIKMHKKLGPNLFFWGRYDHFNILPFCIQKVYLHVVIFCSANIGKKQEYTGGTDSRLGTLPSLSLGGIIENQNSDFVMQWSSMKIPRARGIFLRKSLSKVAAVAASLDTSWPISVMLSMDIISFKVLKILVLCIR